jgi:hypothetical protein
MNTIGDLHQQPLLRSRMSYLRLQLLYSVTFGSWNIGKRFWVHLDCGKAVLQIVEVMEVVELTEAAS